jgi:hypothetical protein
MITLLTFLFLSMPQQPDSLFRTAIEDESTAPYFLLVTIVDDSTGISRPICTTANLFLGAIHIEYNLNYDGAGELEGQRIALSNTKREYHFSRRAALNNIRFTYGPEILDSIRVKLSHIPKDAIQRELAKYGFRMIPEVKMYRNAVAHALIELGFFIREDCVTGAIISDR